MSILFELLEALLSQSAVDIIIESILTGSVVLFLLYGVHGGSRTIKAPRIGKSPWGMGLARARKEFTKHGKRLTEEGYARYKDSMYWVQTADMDRLVLSNKYLDELRKLSDVYLDSKSAVVERNLGWCNRVDIILKSSVHADVCRNQLVQNLGIYLVFERDVD